MSTVRFPEGWAGRDYNRAFVTLKLDRPAPAKGFHIAFELEPRTATPGRDYWSFNPDVAYFEPGKSEHVLAVVVEGDGEVECDEAVALRTWLPNLPSKVRYGYVIVLNDDWEGPPTGPLDSGAAEVAGEAGSVNAPDSGPTDVPLIKDLGNAVRLACHDDPNYDPLATPPPMPDGGVDVPTDIAYVPGQDAATGLDGGAGGTAAPDTAPPRTVDSGAPERGSNSDKSDTAVPSPDGGGCDCSLTAAGRPPFAPTLLIVGAVVLHLVRRRAVRRGRATS